MLPGTCRRQFDIVQVGPEQVAEASSASSRLARFVESEAQPQAHPEELYAGDRASSGMGVISRFELIARLQRQSLRTAPRGGYGSGQSIPNRALVLREKCFPRSCSPFSELEFPSVS